LQASLNLSDAVAAKKFYLQRRFLNDSGKASNDDLRKYAAPVANTVRRASER